MTDDELNAILIDMERIMGSLPHPIHEPIRFAHYVKMWRYYRSREYKAT